MADVSGVSSNQRSEESNLIVALRIRPMNDDEILQGATPIAHRVDDNLVVLMDPMDEVDDILRQNRSREKQFMFDLALDGQCTQEEVYNKTCKLLIPGVINGYNATVFAYGATGAGKTYTMLGKDDAPGIMARALTELFTEMSRTQDDLVYKVTMSYLEIYNELIRDLLNPGSGFLDLREDHKGVQVAGLSEHSASSTEEVMTILKNGNKERTQEPTAANKTSSRSHAVLIVSVKQRHRLAGIHQQLRVGKLFLIDLAGSERAANTQNRGKRMVEGAHINRSLLALGNCINALSDRTGTKYVNYRDSKLTRLLKDALGGNCKTVMIAHISPASFNFEESRNTLTYADRAKNIRTKVRQNVLDMTLHIAQYSSIITELRDEIRRLRLRCDQQQQHIMSQKHMTSQSELRDDSDFIRLKNDLMNVFKTQMDLRQSLMELTNTEAEIGCETTRLDLLIKRLEHEQRMSNSLRQELEKEDRDRINNSDTSLRTSATDPVDLNRARDELESLESERKKTEKMKLNIEKELTNASNKTKKIEEDLRQMCSSKTVSSDQQEIVAMLNKLHSIQVENTQLRSSLAVGQYDTRRRDLHLDWQRHHNGVARLLVHQQRALIDDNELVRPSELDELYDVFEEQSRDISKRRFLPLIDTSKGNSLTAMTSSSQTQSMRSYPRLFTNSQGGNGDTPQMIIPKTTNDDKNRLFVPRQSVPHHDDPSAEAVPPTFLTQVSPRSSGGSPVSMVPSLDYGRVAEDVVPSGYSSTRDTDDIEDLILHGDSRRTMRYGTRGIAQLAANRRAYRNEKVYRNTNLQSSSNLTQSRLAQHDSKYTPLTTIQSRNDDVMSYSTTTTMDAVPAHQMKAKMKSLRRNYGVQKGKQRVAFNSTSQDVDNSKLSTKHQANQSYSRVPVLRTQYNIGGRGNKTTRSYYTVPHHDVNFTEAADNQIDDDTTNKTSNLAARTQPKKLVAPTTTNNEIEQIGVTGFAIQEKN